MPINSKIFEKIDNLNVEEKIKIILKEILKREDEGVKNFKDDYLTIINKIINKEEDK